MNFRDFSRERDLHTLSHRHLTNVLIPGWLKKHSTELDWRIESSAYGETPEAVFSRLLDGLSPADSLLDLGAGAGNLIAQCLSRGVPCWGIEQNRDLVEEGHRFLQSLEMPPGNLIWGDFLTLEWPAARVAFAASSRFSGEPLRLLVERLGENATVEKVLTLGRRLEPGGNWVLSREEVIAVRWNPSEPALKENLCCWERRSERPTPQT